MDKDEFNQLLFSSGVTDMVLSSFSGKSGKKVMQSASDAELLTVTPAILKPVPLWTGKQVIIILTAVFCSVYNFVASLTKLVFPTCGYALVYKLYLGIDE